MESIEKLRELCAKWRKTSITPGRNSAADEVDAIADEIEREIEDKIDGLMATSVDGYPEPFNTPDAMHMVLGTAADCFDTPQEAVHYLRGETSMELPLDADGVPIRCGDVVEGGMGDSGKVQHVELWPDGFVVVYECYPGTFTRYAPDAVRHVKPRTIEDVLRDCCNEWNEHCGSEWEQGVYAKYADEIRGLL